MGPLLIFVLSLCQLHRTAYTELTTDTQKYNSIVTTPLDNENENENDLNSFIPPEFDYSETEAAGTTTTTTTDENNEDIPFVKTGHDQTEVKFQHPISSVNIDYSKNVIVLKFRKQNNPKLRFNFETPDGSMRHRSLEKNFMRFGRSPSDFMRLGKRGQEGMRDSRGDNFMRFGRSHSNDYMRFGRNPSANFMRFGRSPTSDFIRFGRIPSTDYMRFGRNPSADFMRFGRNPSADFMRFGRGKANDFMRFGRNPKGNFMRFGRVNQQKQNFMRNSRPDNFMRFGRTPNPDTADNSPNFMRFGKSDSNFMRFGKSDSNFMRFGKSLSHQNRINENVTKSALDKTDLMDVSNPMDKAINVLYNKQQEQEEIEGADVVGDGYVKNQKINEDADNQKSFEMELDTEYEKEK